MHLLENHLLREAAQAALQEVAAQLGAADSDTAAVLNFIASSINAQETPPIELLLKQLGADYFKFAALQMERGSFESALLLMRLAQHLRPNAPFIEERIEHYRKR